MLAGMAPEARDPPDRVSVAVNTAAWFARGCTLGSIVARHLKRMMDRLAGEFDIILVDRWLDPRQCRGCDLSGRNRWRCPACFARGGDRGAADAAVNLLISAGEIEG